MRPAGGIEPRLGASAEAVMTGFTFMTAERVPLAIAPAAVAVLTRNVLLAMCKPAWRCLIRAWSCWRRESR